MGIFNRKESAKNLALSKEEKSKYFALEIVRAIEAEYHILEEVIKELKTLRFAHSALHR